MANSNSIIGDEIANAMRKNLMAEQAESAVRSDDVTIAMSSLTKAADILENLGDHKNAELVTKLLEKLA
jgi:hypothetical protein